MRLPVIFAIFFLVACTPQVTATHSPPSTTPLPTNTSQPAAIPTVTASPTLLPVTSCETWQSWPVVPNVTEAMRELYRRGQETGNNPRAFSKIGDGEISAEWFFTAFDLGEDHFDLGPYQNLTPVIEHFAGSFARTGMAARRGFNTQRILDESESDPNFCEAGEAPLTCELRLHRPAFAMLSLGTGFVWVIQSAGRY